MTLCFKATRIPTLSTETSKWQKSPWLCCQRRRKSRFVQVSRTCKKPFSRSFYFGVETAVAQLPEWARLITAWTHLGIFSKTIANVRSNQSIETKTTLIGCGAKGKSHVGRSDIALAVP